MLVDPLTAGVLTIITPEKYQDNNSFIATCLNNLMQKHLWCKKVWPSKIESYLEVNTLTDWRQQDLISEYGQNLGY